ncbi:MAG: hypothetical protein IJ134_02360 [Bacilli bacterium]|nr:hypothetical protein [Bacilli bacterium]
MNIYLLKLVGKWLSFSILSLSSFFGIEYHEENMQAYNINENKNQSIVHKVVEYDTKVIYNSNLPSDFELVLNEGQNGISYFDGENEKVIQNMESRVIEKGTGVRNEFVGRITGYGPDCAGCSSVGNVSCRVKNGGKHSLTNDGVFYNDDEYGKVRILAASLDGFPCGTIVQLSNSYTTIFGIVLDTGGSMREAWKKGEVWMDVAYPTENAASSNGVISGRNIKFNIKRWGW